MPEALSTNWLTVPDGLTQVIAVDCGMPSFLANSLLVSTASLRSLINNSLSGLLVSLLSMIPVNDTPSNLSSSVFCLHCLRRYLKSVKVD